MYGETLLQTSDRGVIVNVIVWRWEMCRDASMCCGEGVGAMAAYYCLAVASVLRLGCV